jgi:hypothetical protein
MNHLLAALLAVVVGVLAAPHTGPAPADAPAPMAPCLSEDGSDPGQSFPCVWDAAHRGNGQGTSFVLTGPAE